jgi:hypothetical protein
MQHRGFNAVPRILVWGALALFTLYSGINLVAGPGRDIAFDDLTWTPSAIAQVLVLAALLAGVFARACYVTYRRELAKPTGGVLKLPGARLPLWGEAFLTLVGGVLMLVGTYMLLRVPEALLASNHPTYSRYHSASATPNVMIGLFFGGLGFVLMILRRYVWELRPGQPIRRYWSRAFARAHLVKQPLKIYWTQWCVKRGYRRIPVGHWLRAADPASEGFFRDADLAVVPLDTPPHQLAAMEEAWRTRFAQLAAAPAPAPRQAFVATTSVVPNAIVR